MVKTKVHKYTENMYSTGASQKLECREKVHFFLQVISKSETFIYFRFIACKVKHLKKFFVLILMIRAYSSLKSKVSISKY